MPTTITIIKGEHKNKEAFVFDIKTELGETLYSLKDINGNKLYNGNYTWFPTSFILIK